MPGGLQRTIRLKRRLRRWHIFFIGIGGVIGVGFFNGTSKTLGVAGPGGALMATIIVGLVAVAVMEAICHLICVWPIPNAMVEFVKAFVDEDLGTAIGVLYWSTYCITFSVLVSTIGSLTDYWGVVYLRKTGVYIATPIVLMIINAMPVEVFGWVELIGGILKIGLVIGISALMLVLNIGVGSGIKIGTTFINDAVQYNSNVAHGKFAAVAASFPPAIFAYIGVELLTTTAFEARDPREMRLPARNIGWFATVLYALTAGVFVANVDWTDQQLPKLFSQALTMATDSRIAWPELKINPNVHAAPLIVLLRLGYKFLPGFINSCLIYSAFSCANTALYVASRQLHGLTRSITVTSDSNILRSFLGWLGRVEHRTRSPWPAILASVAVLYWLPFTKRQNNYQPMEDLQTILSAIGSVSCILVWCSQCVAYSFFHHWRFKHWNDIAGRESLKPLLDDENTGYAHIFQPYLSYIATLSTLAIVFVFNTASLWNGERLLVKSLAAFTSPVILLVVYLLKKFTRPRNQWRLWNNLTRWKDFECQVSFLGDLIFPVEPDDAQSEFEVELRGGHHGIGFGGPSASDVSTASGAINHDNNLPPASTPPRPSIPAWAQDDLQFIPHNSDQFFPDPSAGSATAAAANANPRNDLAPLLPPDELDAVHTNMNANRTGVAATTSFRDVDDDDNNTATRTTSNNDIQRNSRSPPSSPTSRYYTGRNSLSPNDARSYPQTHQQQQMAQRSEAELVGSLISPLTSPGLTPVPNRSATNESNITTTTTTRSSIFGYNYAYNPQRRQSPALSPSHMVMHSSTAVSSPEYSRSSPPPSALQPQAYIPMQSPLQALTQTPSPPVAREHSAIQADSVPARHPPYEYTAYAPTRAVNASSFGRVPSRRPVPQPASTFAGASVPVSVAGEVMTATTATAVGPSAWSAVSSTSGAREVSLGRSRTHELG